MLTEALLSLAQKQIQLERYDYLLEPGKIDTNLYVVEEGSLKIFVLDQDEEQIIRFGYRQNILVALDSFLKNTPSLFYIQALKKTTLSLIPKDLFFDFIHSHAEYENTWTSILQDLVWQQMEREIDILTTSPAERYNRVFQRSPQLFQEIPNRYIANYLRMSPETLSRLKKS